MEKILVSSCLIGKKCSYDGGHRKSEPVMELCRDHGCVDVCPELLGGFAVPREKHELVSGTGADVLEGRATITSESGIDRTREFLSGAAAVLAAAKHAGVRLAILKSKSPSCGKGKVYDGTFTGNLVPGNGVTCELLLRNGIAVFTETEVDAARNELYHQK